MVGTESTERLRAEMATLRLRVRELEARLSSRSEPDRIEVLAERLIALSPDLVSVLGFDGYFRQLNPAWKRVVGWTPEELRRVPWQEFVHPEDLETFARAQQELAQGRRVSGFENRFRCRDSSYRQLSWSAVPLPEEELIYATARDTTEQHALELQLRHSQKLEAIGRLAGGIAHDFNNILTTILGNVELALESVARGMPGQPETLEELQEIELGAQRAASLTRQLLAFSQRQSSQPRVVELNRIVVDFQRMLRRLLSENTKLEVNLGAHLPCVRVDPANVEQVLLNLILNARDALQGDGQVLVETAAVDLDPAYLAAHPQAEPGRHVRLSVSDTGHGMDAATLERVFEPFFTTKAFGQGTGLGLPTVHGIVSQAKGHVTVHSEPRSGTRVQVYFPAAEVSSADVEGSASKPETWPRARRGEKILVCEDSRPVRELLVHILEQAGYQVIAAASVREAKDMVRAHAAPIDLLLSGVVLPDGNGPELAEALRRSCHCQRTLLVSGYAAEIATQGATTGGFALLRKPFPRAALLQRVREVLEQGA